MTLRGELWWADLGEPRGSAPARRRPVLVVQSDPFNRSALRTVVVAAVTTNLRLAAMPGNVFLAAPTGGLSEDSVVNVTQLVAVDRQFLDSRLGTLPQHLLDDVERGLRRLLRL
ncbi:MAG: type II toxin-antitoxin system PemK/MazF family toxin [Pseudonocardia sp.]